MGSQEKVANSLGVEFLKLTLPETCNDEDVIAEINKLNEDNNIHGIILQLPLPNNLMKRKLSSKYLLIRILIVLHLRVKENYIWESQNFYLVHLIQ